MSLAASLLVAPVLAASHAGATAVPRSISLPGSTIAVIKTIAVGTTPTYVAVDDGDDTVYVSNITSNTLSVVNGRTGTVSRTLAMGSPPTGVAVHQEDDTIYVALQGSIKGVRAIKGRALDDSAVFVLPTFGSGAIGKGLAVDQSDDTVYVTWSGDSQNWLYAIRGSLDDSRVAPLGGSPGGVAVDNLDDTVFVANGTLGSSVVSLVSGRTLAITSVGVGANPNGVAVNQVDDTVYVANSSVAANSVSVINGRTGLRTDDTVSVGSGPRGVAVDQRDDTVYVTNSGGSGSVSVINGRTATRTDDTVSVGSGPTGITVDDSGPNAGLVYVTNQQSDTVSVIGRVTPSLTASSGAAGNAMTLNVDVPQVAYDVDDSTVQSVAFGNNNATSLAAASGDAWTMTVPAGSGTVDVIVTFNGGLKASAGSFTYGSAPGPTPAPVYPPSPPREVAATAGDASASVSWVAPADSGSYPITNYQAIASPGGRTCLVAAPALTCEVLGLTNGTSYTFTVQALNGAGWGAAGGPSNAVTPTASVVESIVITGSRSAGDPRRVEVSGSTTGLVGARVDPWFRFPGQTSYTEGVGVQTVDAAGTFTWSRKTGKKISVYFTHGDVRSNTVTIGAR